MSGGEGALPRAAIVTGAAGGIGAAICAALAERGHAVAVTDLDPERAAAVAAGLDGEGHAGIAMDVTDAASVRAAVERAERELGPLGVLVNNAGWEKLMPFIETDEALWRDLLEVNLVGTLRVTHAALPAMLERGAGRVVNIASDAGRVGSSLEGVYSAAKGGVIAFTKTIAREAARRGVTANAVCPGPTDTPLLRGIAEEGELGRKVSAAMARLIPMKRIGTPADVAAAVAYLASEEAAYVTGQTLSVSGGLTMV